MRPLHRRGAIRSGTILAAIGAVVLACIAVAAVYLFVPVGLRGAAEAVIAHREKVAGITSASSENSWPNYRRVLEEIQQAHERVIGRSIWDQSQGRRALSWGVDFDLGPAGDEQNASSRAAVLAELARLGTLERLDGLVGKPTVPEDPTEAINLAQPRQLARILQSRIVDAQDVESIKREMERLRVIATQARALQSSFSQLTAIAIEDLAATAVVRVSLSRPLSTPDARALIATLSERSPLSLEPTLEGQRLAILRSIAADEMGFSMPVGMATRGVVSATAELRTLVDRPELPRAPWYDRLERTVPSRISDVLLASVKTLLRARDQRDMRNAAAQTIIALESRIAATRNAPATLDELVPEFFDALPIDPYSGKPFCYRTRTSEELTAHTPAKDAWKPGLRPYLLYSVGEDGVDHGGLQFNRPGANTPPRTNVDQSVTPDDGTW